MRATERGFLLLTSQLGNPERKVLSPVQLRTLAQRCWQLDVAEADRELSEQDLRRIGYGEGMARRILSLLSEEALLAHYLRKAARAGCVPLTRVSEGYPLAVRKRLGLDSPGVLWAKGNLSLLETTKISLVGSRDLEAPNREFAREAGRQAALQGYTLVSGNARGADRTAQESCLAHGGNVIVVVADALIKHEADSRVLILSEEDYDQDFSPLRALRRNRVIHAMGNATLVSQCGLGTGGTWDGTVRNLKYGYSPVFCFRDGSETSFQLEQLGAQLTDMGKLQDLSQFCAFIPPLI